MSSLLMQAAQSAAQADGIIPEGERNGMGGMESMMGMPVGGMNSGGASNSPKADMMQNRKAQMGGSGGSGGGGKKKGPALRRGKWTPEEEAYANRLIQEFKAGLLPLTDGTTLRTFLSKLLNCDPMRISKKFVGSNCIGKQVFRRRTADLNRLTPDQIQKSRAELSELERRFLERVAQTNRVKSSGVGGGATGGAPTQGGGVGENVKKEDLNDSNHPSPPWLQPPLGYKQGNGAAMAAANLSGENRAAAAGRALLAGLNPGASQRKPNSDSALSSHGSANLLAMAELQRRASQQGFLQNMSNTSMQNLLNAAGGSQGNSLADMVRTASAARMAGLGRGNQNSMNNLMLKTGFSRDQLGQLARDRGLSSASLSNMIERKSSFDALAGLDFQSLQSIDNLANLIQSGGSTNNIPSSGMKNGSWDTYRHPGSSSSLSNVARRLASAGNMESLLRSLSGNNVQNNNNGNNGNGNEDSNGGRSSGDFQSLLQNMQNGSSMSSLLGGHGNAASAASLANLLRENSSTGLTALRMQDGLNQRNSSVEDFLSLVAAGDIPHQDPNLLNVPLMHNQQNQNGGVGGNNNGLGGSGHGNDHAAMLAQQQLLAQATGNPALANALASRSFQNFRNGSGVNLTNSSSAAALLAHAAGGGGGGDNSSSLSLKRKLLELDGGLDQQGGSGSNKR